MSAANKQARANIILFTVYLEARSKPAPILNLYIIPLNFYHYLALDTKSSGASSLTFGAVSTYISSFGAVTVGFSIC